MGSGLELYGRRREWHEFPGRDQPQPLETEEGMLVSSTIRDVTERKKAEELRSQLAAIVDSSDDAVVGKSLDGDDHELEQGAARVFGYAAEESDREADIRCSCLPDDREKSRRSSNG